MYRKTFAIALTAFIGFALLLGACTSAPKPTDENPVPGKSIASGPIGNDLKVTLSSDTGKLKTGDQEIMVAFTDASGKPVDVGTVSAAAVSIHMPAMGSMAAMNDAVTLST